ncbi:MAG: family 16 glycosylhydrolase [Bdellovibrio sp.]
MMKRMLIVSGIFGSLFASAENSRLHLNSLFESQPLRTTFSDNFQHPSLPQWEKMNHTFGCNETQFNPNNIVADHDGLTLHMTHAPTPERNMSGAEVTADGRFFGGTGNRNFHYGRFEVRLKMTKAPGTVASFFLYRSDPWQEIDIEFLGRDTRTIQFNVFYNDGPEGTEKNEPIMFPIRLSLPFDAADDFHTYAFEWGDGEIRWYIDGQLFHTRKDPATTPNLPMTLRMNYWATCDSASDWAGKFNPGSLPLSVQYKGVRVHQLASPQK